MDAPCEFAVKFLFPIVRSELSRVLINKFKLTQIETANKLGITQAAVSQYINEKRGINLKKLSKEIQEIISRSINSLDAKYVEGLDKEKFKTYICDICLHLRKFKFI